MRQAQTQPHETAGLKSQPPRYEFRASSYERFQVIYVLHGCLHFEISGATQPLTPDTVLLLREGSAFRLFTTDKGYDGVCYVCTGGGIPAFRGTSRAMPAPSRLRALARLMRAEADAPRPESTHVLLGMGKALAWQTISVIDSPPAPGNVRDSARQCAESARQALDIALYTGQTAPELLAGLGKSYRQLSRHFVAAFGIPPKQYQLRARMREAQQMLRTTTLSITAIAYELGFSSSQHFATQFAAIAGLSPSDFRAGRSGIAANSP